MVRKFIILAVLAGMLLVAATTWGRSNVHLASVTAVPNVGGKIAYARGGAIWVYTAGNQRQLTTGPKDRQDKRDVTPSFSPDGTQIIYSRTDEGFSDLYKLNVSGPARPVALTDHRPNVEVGQVEEPGVREGYNKLALWASYPAWSPDGDRITFTSDAGTEYPNLRVISPEGNNERKLASTLDFSQQTVEHPSWSPDGRKIVAANYTGTLGSTGQIWSYSLATEKWTALTESKEGAYDPAWSPDGEWIAFTMRENGMHNIYVIPTDPQRWTGNYPTPIQLTTGGATRSPAWSPDGSRLAYIALKGTAFDLYAGSFTADTGTNPTLEQVQQLTDNANIDATSGLSWGQ